MYQSHYDFSPPSILFLGTSLISAALSLACPLYSPSPVDFPSIPLVFMTVQEDKTDSQLMAGSFQPTDCSIILGESLKRQIESCIHKHGCSRLHKSHWPLPRAYQDAVVLKHTSLLPCSRLSKPSRPTDLLNLSYMNMPANVHTTSTQPTQSELAQSYLEQAACHNILPILYTTCKTTNNASSAHKHQTLTSPHHPQSPSLHASFDDNPICLGPFPPSHPVSRNHQDSVLSHCAPSSPITPGSPGWILVSILLHIGFVPRGT